MFGFDEVMFLEDIFEFLMGLTCTIMIKAPKQIVLRKGDDDDGTRDEE